MDFANNEWAKEVAKKVNLFVHHPQGLKSFQFSFLHLFMQLRVFKIPDQKMILGF